MKKMVLIIMAFLMSGCNLVVGDNNNVNSNNDIEVTGINNESVEGDSIKIVECVNQLSYLQLKVQNIGTSNISSITIVYKIKSNKGSEKMGEKKTIFTGFIIGAEKVINIHDYIYGEATKEFTITSVTIELVSGNIESIKEPITFNF